MTEPITTIAAGAVLKLAFDEFIKSGAGEAAKKLSGAALEKANELRKLIWSYFIDKNNQKATDAIADIETKGSETALGKLEVHLEIAMEADKLFADRLREISHDVETLRVVSQVMVDKFKGKNLNANDLSQDASPGSMSVEQTMFQDVEAETVNLSNLTQKA